MKIALLESNPQLHHQHFNWFPSGLSRNSPRPRWLTRLAPVTWSLVWIRLTAKFYNLWMKTLHRYIKDLVLNEVCCCSTNNTGICILLLVVVCLFYLWLNYIYNLEIWFCNQIFKRFCKVFYICNRDTYCLCWGFNSGPLAGQSSTLPIKLSD